MSDTPNIKPGLFIVLEGIDCSGKTTAAKYLIEKLNSLGLTSIATREIGGITNSGQALRKLIYSTPTDEVIDPSARVLMMYASRIQNIKNTIFPAAAKGISVVCDRWSDSTHVYQGMNDELKELVEGIEALDKLSYLAVRPDYLFFFDITAETSMTRGKERGAVDNDLYKNNLERTKKIAQFYKNRMTEMSILHSKPIYHIDAEQSQEEVFKQLDKYAEQIVSQFSNCVNTAL